MLSALIVSCLPHGDEADHGAAPGEDGGHVDVCDHADCNPSLLAGHCPGRTDEVRIAKQEVGIQEVEAVLFDRGKALGLVELEFHAAAPVGPGITEGMARLKLRNGS